MLTKAQGKYIRSLSTTEGRREAGAFRIEGPKLIAEWLENAPESVLEIYATDRWEMPQITGLKFPEIRRLRESEIAGLSQLQTPPAVLAVCRLPEPGPLLTTGWTLACETLQDPGNLGTILRIADWYGVQQVVCSEGSADFYNPKVVQAGMGAHLRVQTAVVSLAGFLKQTSLPVFAATLSGKNIYETPPERAGILLIGNESKGLSEATLAYATHQVMIPRRGGAESLNAAVATGILCDRLMAF